MLRKKTEKLGAVLLAVALGATLFAGCGKKEESKAPAARGEDQVIRYNLGAEPKTIDPALNDAVDGATVIQNTFEGLLRLDDKDVPVAGVAEKWEMSTDGLTYTFHLRKDAKWSDGKTVTAQDFEYSWKRALNPETAANYAYYLFVLKNGEAYNSSADPKYTGKKATIDEVGVKAKDESTLVVTLEDPCAYFYALMAFPTFYPVRKDVVEKDPKAWYSKSETAICNGPFKLKSWTPKETITLVPNETYWDTKRVKLAKVEMKMIEAATSSLAAFKTGQLDYIESPPSQEIPNLLADKTAQIVPYLGVYYLNFNMTDKDKASSAEAKKVLSDVRVRKALAYAINRKELVENVTKGGQKPAAAFVPYGIPEDKSGKDFRDYKKEYFNPEGDLTQAKKLLADAGYPDGKGFPKLVYLYNTNEGHQNIAQAIQEMWRKNLGIDITLQNQEWKVFQQTRTDRQYEIARDGWIADYVDPMTFSELITTKSGNNNSGYTSADYDAKIVAAKKEVDPAKRMKSLHEAEDILMNDMPVIPLYFYTNVICVKPYVKDVHKSPLGFVFFDRAYVDKSAK